MQKLINPIWKLDKHDGYLYTYAPDHPYANKSGKIRQHRYLKSLEVGYWIPSEYVVHHKDHNRSNNSLDNLEILSASEHAALHAGGYKSSKECEVCHTLHTNDKYCSLACRDIANRDSSVDIDKETLEKLIWSMSYVKVGKILGLSDNGVRKRAKSLGCIMPPPRFHVKSAEFRK